MNIKYIVIDIDGTLLNDEKIITNKTKETLILLQELYGIKIILASGRPTSGMLHLAQSLKMNKYQGLLVSYNGACITDCETNEIIFQQPLSILESQAVLNHMKQFDVIPMIDKDDYMYVNDVYNCMVNYRGSQLNIIEYESRGGNFKLSEKEDLASFVDFPLNKILTAGNPEYLKENYQAMMEPFKNQLSCMFTADFFFEFTAKDIDKAKALDKVLKPLNHSSDMIIAFGDGHNDISLIEYAGIGVAMANAVDDLKRVANEITLSNNDDGVATFLEVYFKL